MKFINSQGGIYEGDLAAGDRGATPAELTAWQLAAQPTYRQLRAAAYPPSADYLDAWVKNDTVALEAYRSACLSVKVKYPKV